VKAIADTYSQVHGRQIDWNDEILCTVGAHGSLFCAVQGLINPGDEVGKSFNRLILFLTKKTFYAVLY
jgi:aspartate/methionine/tyrosine aminotransferase